MTAVSSLFLIIPLIIPNYSFSYPFNYSFNYLFDYLSNYSFNYSFNYYLEALIIPIIRSIITNYCLLYPQQICQFLVVAWCTFHVLNCPHSVQTRKLKNNVESFLIIPMNSPLALLWKLK